MIVYITKSTVQHSNSLWEEAVGGFYNRLPDGNSSKN